MKSTPHYDKEKVVVLQQKNEVERDLTSRLYIFIGSFFPIN
jgi:hypothetical protein